MKTLLPSLILAVVLSGAHAHEKSGHHAPKHGGVVAEHRDVDLELVAKTDVLVLHVRDHDGKPRDLGRASAIAKMLSGQETLEAELKPAGGVLRAEGTFPVKKGTRIVVVLRGVAKGDISTRFVLP